MRRKKQELAKKDEDSASKSDIVVFALAVIGFINVGQWVIGLIT
jgi:hypothetical protein